MNRRGRIALAILPSLFDPAAAEEPSAPQRVRIDIASKPWEAVGQVNNEAYGRCTGVLVGRQLAVTAAHCLYNKGTQRFLRPQAIHFVLGYDRGTYKFGTVAAAIHLDPGYDPKRPLESLRGDWALLELSEPAPASFEPMPLAAGEPQAGDVFVSAGFGRDRAYALTAAEACRYVPASPSGIVAAECAIVKGYSGGPMVNGKGELVGIQVAAGRVDGKDVALAVPTSAWRSSER